jgi:CHASE3 domain sensor protein
LIRLVLLGAILAIVVAVWGVGKLQASADDSSTNAITAGQQMLTAMLDQETGLRGFINTHRQQFLEPYRNGRASLEMTIAAARRNSTDSTDERNLNNMVVTARAWQRLAETELADLDAGGKATLAAAIHRKRMMDRFRAANRSFVADNNTTACTTGASPNGERSPRSSCSGSCSARSGGCCSSDRHAGIWCAGGAWCSLATRFRSPAPSARPSMS